MASSGDVAAALRGFALALTAFGLAATTVDLVFLEHYEETPMLIPLAVNVLALAAILLHALGGTAGTVRVLRLVMVAVVVTSLVGIVLHYRGSLEFQIDMDPTLSASQLFWKVMHMKAPPTLAPGALAQLGLLGLSRHVSSPRARQRGPVSSPRSMMTMSVTSVLLHSLPPRHWPLTLRSHRPTRRWARAFSISTPCPKPRSPRCPA